MSYLTYRIDDDAIEAVLNGAAIDVESASGGRCLLNDDFNTWFDADIEAEHHPHSVDWDELLRGDRDRLAWKQLGVAVERENNDLAKDDVDVIEAPSDSITLVGISHVDDYGVEVPVSSNYEVRRYDGRMDFEYTISFNEADDVSGTPSTTIDDTHRGRDDIDCSYDSVVHVHEIDVA